MHQSFLLRRPPLEVGGEYWFFLEEDWLTPSPVFSILTAVKIAGPKEKGYPIDFCKIINAKGRWLSEAPLMEWHSSLLKKVGGVFALDSQFRENYNTALSKWASAQAKGASKAPVPPAWEFSSAVWPPPNPKDPTDIEPGNNWSDYFETADITQGTGVVSSSNVMKTGAALSMSWMHDIPPEPDGNVEGEGDLVIAYVDLRLDGWVDTCLGHVSLKIKKARVFWNANVNAQFDGSPLTTFSSAGIWMHEVGHLLGLNHRPSGCPGKTDAVMVGGMDIGRSWGTFSLAADDVARIQELYPREVAFDGGFKQNC